MPPGSYTFRSVWRLNARPEEVYDVLERLQDYPLWWPQVRTVTSVNEDACEIVCRSFLPYALRFTTTQAVRDPANGVLQGSMAGDLEGFSRWTVAGGSGETTAVFDETVVTTKPLLRRIERVTRPVLKGNHWWMMRQGERGLRSYLAGDRANAR